MTRGVGFGTMPAVEVCDGCLVSGFAEHACAGGECSCAVDRTCARYKPAWVEHEEDRVKRVALTAPFIRPPLELTTGG